MNAPLNMVGNWRWDVASTTQAMLTRLQGNLDSSSDDLAASMKAIRKSSLDIQKAVEQLTAQNSVIAKLSAPATADSLATTVKNLESISQDLLNVTRDTQKIVQGVSTIFQTP